MANEHDTSEIPNNLKQAYSVITTLTDKFCYKHLNEEYAHLAHELAATLCKFNPSPLLRGNKNILACGIIYALGFVNFLFDKDTNPYISADDLCTAFEVKKSSAYNKSVLIRNALGMVQFDPGWCLPSLMDQNPLVWMIEIDGLTVDVRHLPRKIQEIAYQKGLIPYIPETDEGMAVINDIEVVEDIGEENKRSRLQDHEEKKVKKKKKHIDPSQISLDF